MKTKSIFLAVSLCSMTAVALAQPAAKPAASVQAAAPKKPASVEQFVAPKPLVMTMPTRLDGGTMKPAMGGSAPVAASSVRAIPVAKPATPIVAPKKPASVEQFVAPKPLVMTMPTRLDGGTMKPAMAAAPAAKPAPKAAAK